MKFFKFTIVIFSVVSLIGCAAESKVKISKAPVQDTEGKIKFKLPKTVVNILKTENTDGKLNFTISAFTSQVEADDTIYAISPSDSFGVKTNLNFTHTIDSDYLLSTLSFDVEDNRIKTIQNVGGLIVSAIPILMGGASGKDDKIVPGETDPFPIMMDIDEAYLKNGNKGLIKKMREKMPKTNWEFDIEFTKLSDDVIPISNIDQLLNKQSNVFFTAACRTVKIKFGENADLLKNKSFTFLITDPHFVSTVKIPTKGSIKMRSTCGVDVTNDKATTDSSLQVIETVLTQGKSIDDALKLEKASTKSTK